MGSAMKFILSVLIMFKAVVCCSQPDQMVNKLSAVEWLVKDAVSEAEKRDNPRALEIANRNLNLIYSDSGLSTSNIIDSTDETLVRLHLEILSGCTILKKWRLRDAESVYQYYQTNKNAVVTGSQEVVQDNPITEKGDARDFAISRIYNDALHYVQFRLKHSNTSVVPKLRALVDELAGPELKKVIFGPDGQDRPVKTPSPEKVRSS